MSRKFDIVITVRSCYNVFEGNCLYRSDGSDTWTFVMQSDGEPPEAIIGYILDEAKHLMRHYKELYPSAKFSPITETTVEVED